MSRILIIDEEESSRELLSVYSEMLGHDVCVVEKVSSFEGRHACEECSCSDEKGCTDILLVNHRFSDSTGFDFIQDRVDNRCKVPIHNIAIMSNQLSNQEFRKAKQIGCHCLQKPVTYEILESWLEKINRNDLNAN